MRDVSIVSSSATADRDEERNVNPAGWPSTDASSPTSARRWSQPLKASREGVCPGKKTSLRGTVRGPSRMRHVHVNRRNPNANTRKRKKT